MSSPVTFASSPTQPDADLVLLAVDLDCPKPALPRPELARPEQRPPAGNWRTWYVRGGRGSGKSWTGAATLADWITGDLGGGEWAVVAPTYQDAWATCIEGPSGLLAALGTTAGEVKHGDSDLVEYWHRSWAHLRLRDGTVIWAASADDGGLRIQGKNLRGAWCDEVGLWQRWAQAWDESIAFAVRMPPARIVATGTPKASMPARVLVKRLLEDPLVPVATLRTLDNAANLSETFLTEVVGRAKGTRLERQELEGELVEDVEGALWTPSQIDAHRIDAAPPLERIVVGIDPAATSHDHSDETGIVVAGIAGSGPAAHFYVLEDLSQRATPQVWATAAAAAYERHGADRVVGEVNNGGEMVEHTLRSVAPNIAYQSVHASRGKRLRAEPVAALYEQGRVHHVGVFPALEEQMCFWTPESKISPDRMDAMVWALTKLAESRSRMVFAGRATAPVRPNPEIVAVA